MSTFLKFFYEFFMTFFRAVFEFIKDFFVDLFNIFNVVNYGHVFDAYMRDFNAFEWILAILTVLIVIAGLVLLVWWIVLRIKKAVLKHRKNFEKQELLEQIDDLNRQVIKLIDEKDKIMAMQVSKLGIRPGEETAALPEGSGRFVKLAEVDRKYAERPFTLEYTHEFTLKEFVESFRQYACGTLKLYYEEKVIRTFVAGMAASKIIILEGISGTGKTSLPYAFGKFLMNDSSIVAVQPSWRDRTELIGYLNEFTKRFNETDFLKSLYEATYRTDVGFIVLDEMNLARIEYYFAEVLSVLEMPNEEEWKLDIVPDTRPGDPKHIVGGKLKFPVNLWFVGTANNDDSTFTITDKVYDRAVPIVLNSKGQPFECEEAPPLQVEYRYLESLFNQAYEEYPISPETLEKFDQLDDYIIENFRLAFGNRILKQMLDFVPVYVAAGGTELEGVDYILAHKILRKLEGLNIAFAQEGLKKLIAYLDRLFGKKNMEQSKEYLTELLRSAGI